MDEYVDIPKGKALYFEKGGYRYVGPQKVKKSFLVKRYGPRVQIPDYLIDLKTGEAESFKWQKPETEKKEKQVKSTKRKSTRKNKEEVPQDAKNESLPPKGAAQGPENKETETESPKGE